MYSAIFRRMAASGSRVRPALRLSTMYATRSVPGMTAFTASWPIQLLF
jgi:hypothetical protein